MTGSEPIPGDYSSGDVTADQPNASQQSNRSRAIARVELVVISGDEGDRLHRLQCEAVHEALLWIATHRRTEPKGHA